MSAPLPCFTLLCITKTSMVHGLGIDLTGKTMNRLHDKGYIDNPVGKAKSVYIFPEGVKKAKGLFLQISNGTFSPYGHRLFSIDDITGFIQNGYNFPVSVPDMYCTAKIGIMRLPRDGIGNNLCCEMLSKKG